MHQNIRDDFNQLADCCILQAEYFLKNQDGEFYLYPQSIDAIATVMAHCESKDQFVYYFPYAIAGEKIEFYEAFGEKTRINPMKPILLIFFLVCSIFINAQDKIPVTKKRIDTIHSYILNEDRYLYVNLPENTNGISELPVIYVLDAEVLFDAVNNTMNRLSKEGSTKKAIILGIGNIWQRYRDYSPTHINSSPFVDAHSASVSGGGEKFISFIEKEVFPYTRSKYSTSSDRILIGHSMGGLIAMNILLKNARMFNYYACIDPSMWWDDRRLLKESKRILADNTFENRTLFLAVANTEQHDMDVPEIKLDSTDKTALIRPSLLLADYLSSNQQNKLRFGWKFFKDHDHMSVPAPAMYDALRFFFN